MRRSAPARALRLIVVLIGALVCGRPAAAQQLPSLPGFGGNAAPQIRTINEAMIDLSVPPSPAFNVLGLTPETVDHPTTARRFATALVNGVDRDGHLQTGVAFDTAPYLLAFGERITLDGYRRRPDHSPFDRYMVRLLSRFSVSGASAKASTDDDKAVRLSVGFRLTLWDLGDPRTDQQLLDCFTDDLPELPVRLLLEPDDPGPTATADERARFERLLAEFRLDAAVYEARRAAFNSEWTAAADACRTDARRRNWNDSSWIVAGAPTFFSGDGSLSSLSASGAGLWSTLSYGFEGVPGLEDSAQLSFHGRLRKREPVAVDSLEGAFVDRDGSLVGAQLRAGTRDTTVALEVLHERSRFTGQGYTNHTRFGLALERRLNENLWLNVAIGEGADRPAGQSAASYLLTALRWGFSQSRTLPIPGAPGAAAPAGPGQ